VNTGLWETTAQIGGATAAPQLPADQLAKMPPAQQDTIKKAMAAAMAARTMKRCVTQATLDRGIGQSITDSPQGAKGCAVVTVSAGRHSAEYQVTCNTERYSSSGTLKLDAPDAQTLDSVLDGSFTLNGGPAQPLHVVSHSRWLASDCGDVKPKE
jgi:hypothetical protein